jgi:hypothetical protein
MPQTLTSAATAHPVLVEVTETRLVWIEADNPAAAAEQAPAFVNDVTGPGALAHLPLVDQCLQARAVTSELADWLDADPDQVEHLDAYFAARAQG